MSKGDIPPLKIKKYRVSMVHVVCIGPIDALVAIKVNKKGVWSGNFTSNGILTIDKPQFFGGENREGGLQGNLEICFGGDTQTGITHYSNKFGASSPGFQGLS